MRGLSYIISTALFFHLFCQSPANLYVDGVLVKRDSSLNQSWVYEEIRKLHYDGYLFSGLDSVTSQGFFVHRGSLFSLMNGGETSSLRAVRKAVEKKWRAAINDGYPFARLYWDTLKMKNMSLEVSFKIKNGPLIKYDSIILARPVNVRRSYLENALLVRKNERYSEADFRAISDKLDGLRFLKSNGQPDVSFQSGKAWIYLDLDNAENGRFQGVLGLLPGQSTDGNPIVVGSIDLELYNLFRSGKELDLFWNRFDQQSQNLEMTYRHSYLLNSDMTMSVTLALLRQDTAFTTTRLGLTGEWAIGRRHNLGFSYNNEESNVFLTDTDRILALEVLDYQQQWYGLQIRTYGAEQGQLGNQLNYSFSLNLGTKKTLVNPVIDPLVYNDLDLDVTNWKMEGLIGGQKMVSRRLALYSHLSVLHLSGTAPSNQLFRLGGSRTLRGFNENFFYAATAITNRFEFRSYFEERSFLFLFLDQGFIQNDDWDRPMGLGSGLSMETASGLFSFAFAMGRSNGVKADPSNVKVHFGYISRF